MEKTIFYTSQTKTSCNGGKNSSHPLIYLDLSKEGKAICPYCSRVLIYREKNEHQS
jgi:uncharacterized Zn-finger protein